MEELSFRVTLIERALEVRIDPEEGMSQHFNSKRPDCLSVTRSKCPKGEFKPKAKHSFETDLLGDRKRSWGRITHIVDEDEPRVPPLPELTYEVCYPRPKTAYPSFTPLSTAKLYMRGKYVHCVTYSTEHAIENCLALFLNELLVVVKGGTMYNVHVMTCFNPKSEGQRKLIDEKLNWVR